MAGASEYKATASSVMEYLLIEHRHRSQISALPDHEVERLRKMVAEAVRLKIEPHEIYDAITRGFNQASAPVSSPSLAYQFDEQPDIEEKLGALVALAQTVRS